jgi:hypothetical protein
VLWARVFAVGDAPSGGGRGARERRLLGVEPFKSNVSKWPISDRFSARKLPVSPKNPRSQAMGALDPLPSSVTVGYRELKKWELAH